MTFLFWIQTNRVNLARCYKNQKIEKHGQKKKHEKYWKLGFQSVLQFTELIVHCT